TRTRSLTASFAIPTPCRPTSRRSWDRRSVWSSSTRRSSSRSRRCSTVPPSWSRRRGRSSAYYPAATSSSSSRTVPASDVRALGIDVGVRKGLDLVLLDQDRAVLDTARHVSVDDLHQLVPAFRRGDVALDPAP